MVLGLDLDTFGPKLDVWIKDGSRLDRVWIEVGSRLDRGWIEDEWFCWSVGRLAEQPPTPLSAAPPVGEKSQRDCPRKKTTFGFARVGWPVMYQWSGESMSVGRLLIPTRRGVGGLSFEVVNASELLL